MVIQYPTKRPKNRSIEKPIKKINKKTKKPSSCVNMPCDFASKVTQNQFQSDFVLTYL